MIWPTSKITIPEKPCGISQTYMDWLRLLTSSNSSKVASLKNFTIPSRHMTRALGLLEFASLKITSIPSMQHSDSYLSYQISKLVFLVLWYYVKWLDSLHTEGQLPGIDGKNVPRPSGECVQS